MLSVKGPCKIRSQMKEEFWHVSTDNIVAHIFQSTNLTQGNQIFCRV